MFWLIEFTHWFGVDGPFLRWNNIDNSKQEHNITRGIIKENETQANQK